ncbi:hypothetical protein LINPERHAP1_LOCUS16741 [Linum perenne]
MAPETKPILSKLKPGSSSNQDGSNRKRIEISSKQPIKSVKIESSSKQPIKSVKIESSSSKQPIKSVSTVTRTEVKSTTTSTSKATTTTTKTTRVKKVFSLAGQRYDPPEEREPVRIFYESLSEQIPTSEMAEFWMMEHGLLSPERSKKAFEKKQRKQKMQRTGIPIKSPKTPSKPESSSQRQQQASKNGDMKSKKRVVDDSDDDDNLVLSAKRRKW